MRSLTINGQAIGDAEPCYVIAEIGSNHGGSVDRATALIEAALDCGCSAAKPFSRASSPACGRRCAGSCPTRPQMRSSPR